MLENSFFFLCYNCLLNKNDNINKSVNKKKVHRGIIGDKLLIKLEFLGDHSIACQHMMPVILRAKNFRLFIC